MKAIYKYVVGLPGELAEVPMPRGAEVVHFATQGGRFCVWAIVETEREPETRIFVIHGTGWEITAHPGFQGQYVGSLLDGPYVWHLFEEVQA